MLGIKIHKAECQQPGKQDAKRCLAVLKRSNNAEQGGWEG